jgi:hypothetical protein
MSRRRAGGAATSDTGRAASFGIGVPDDRRRSDRRGPESGIRRVDVVARVANQPKTHGPTSVVLVAFGSKADGENRTHNPRFTKAVLYR